MLTDAVIRSPVRPHRLLLVEDEVFVRAMMARLLGEAGYIVEGAVCNGLEAVAAMRGGGFDALITDYRMAGPNGLELLKLVRTGDTGVARDFPVVVVTAYADPQLELLTRRLDGNGLVVKPFRAHVLRRELAEALAARPRLRTVEAYREVALPPDPGKGRAASQGVAAANAGASGQCCAQPPAPIADLQCQPAAARMLPPAELRPGQVLAADVITSSGRLLLKNRTVLDGLMIALLVQLRRSDRRLDRVAVHGVATLPVLDAEAAEGLDPPASD